MAAKATVTTADVSTLTTGGAGASGRTSGRASALAAEGQRRTDLARVRLAQGRVDAAVNGLRLALAPDW